MHVVSEDLVQLAVGFATKFLPFFLSIGDARKF